MSYLYVRPLSVEERAGVEGYSRSLDAVTYRRAQMVLLSANGVRVEEIARSLGVCA